jgi:hypothetical protein
MRTFLYSVILFTAGALFGAFLNQTKKPTWQEVIQAMPIEIRRNIAIDYCASNRGLCKSLPLSSPIDPMDAK